MNTEPVRWSDRRGGDFVKYIGFHCIAQNDPTGCRDWGVDNWAGLIRLIVKRSWIHIIFIGSIKDRGWYDELFEMLTPEERLWIVDFSGMTEVRDIPFILRRSINALVCINSSIMNFAVDQGTPMVAIIGGTPAKVLMPDSPHIRYIEDEALNGCHWKDHSPVKHPRLKEIRPEIVMSLLEEVLALDIR